MSLLGGTGYSSPPPNETRLPALSRATTRDTAATLMRGNMYSNTKKLAVIYPSVYCKQIVTPPPQDELHNGDD